MKAMITKIEEKIYPWPVWESCFEDITKKELLSYKTRVYKEARVNWEGFPSQITHLVFYSELLNKSGKTDYAHIYLNGAYDACTEEEFEEKYQKPNRFTIALHRR